MSEVVAQSSGAHGGESGTRPFTACLRPSRRWDIVWLCALVIYVVAGRPIAPFHGDEATQITMSRDYAYQFIQHDLDLIAYKDEPVSPTEQELRLLNGTINKYTIGLAWHLGGFSPDDINEQWDWGADWGYNQQYGHAPTEGLLQAARWPSTLFTSAGVIIIFAIGWQLYRRPTAYLASLYYALNPVILLNGRRAMMEGSLLCFTLLAVLAGIWFLQRRAWWTAALLGIAAGLALASKHTALFTVVGVFGACGVYLAFCFLIQRIRAHHDTPLRFVRSFVQMAVAGIITLTVFIVLNPAWWGTSPLKVGQTVLDLREDLLDIQVDGFGGYSDMADQVAGFARQVLIAGPQYYEAPAWDGYIGGQIAIYQSSAWRGVSVASLGGLSTVGAVILLGVIGVGAWSLAHDRQIDSAVRVLVGMWSLVTVGAILLLTPLEWQRYYLPVYPVVGLLAAAGLVRSARLIARVTGRW